MLLALIPIRESDPRPKDHSLARHVTWGTDITKNEEYVTRRQNHE